MKQTESSQYVYVTKCLLSLAIWKMYLKAQRAHFGPCINTGMTDTSVLAGFMPT